MTNARATKIDKLSNTNCRERIETEQVEDGRGESSQARAEKQPQRCEKDDVKEIQMEGNTCRKNSRSKPDAPYESIDFYIQRFVVRYLMVAHIK